jgi:hypothetical protein
MKKIIKPKQNEEATYFSDFTGKPLGEFGPITLKIDCGYGSRFDGGGVTFHLDDNDILELMKFLKTKVSEDFKNQIKNHKKKLEKDYDEAFQFREWDSTEYLNNSIGLYEELL